MAKGQTIPKLEHKHDLVKTDRREASHGKDGSIEYYTCSACGRLYSDEAGTREISLADTVITGGGDSHAYLFGGNEDSHWMVCECGDVINKEAHTLSEWVVTKAATETEKGRRERKCSVCGYWEAEEIGAQADSDLPESPDTGDESLTVLYIALTALTGMAVLLVNRRRFIRR